MAISVQRYANASKLTTLLDDVQVDTPKWCVCGRGLNRSVHERDLKHKGSFKDSQWKDK